MGYYVNTIGGKVTIPAVNVPDALAAVQKEARRLSTPTRKGIVNKYYERVINAPTLVDAMAELGFFTEADDNAVYLTGYYDKSRDEDTFLSVLSPFATSDSFFEWVGEEYEHWRTQLGGEKMVSQEGIVVYP